jgi:hypothetical protein
MNHTVEKNLLAIIDGLGSPGCCTGGASCSCPRRKEADVG